MFQRSQFRSNPNTYFIFKFQYIPYTNLYRKAQFRTEKANNLEVKIIEYPKLDVGCFIR